MHSISRRGLVISAATATAAFGLKGPLAIVGDAHAQAKAGHLKYKVGDIEAISVHDGHTEFSFGEGFARNAKLEDVKAAVKAVQGTDEKLRVPFAMTVIRNGGKVTLIDTGTGAQVSPAAGQYMANLAAAGIDPASVSTILISHFHGDHIFGLMAKDTNAQVFPNAQILVSETEYKWWTDPTRPDQVPERQKGLARRIQATFPTWKNISQFQWGKEVVPGITAVEAVGHTIGHTAFLVASGGKQLMVQGDVSNVPFLFAKNPNWHFTFDDDGPKAEATRRAMYDRVIADKMMIAGYHWDFPNVGTIAKDGNGYAFTPVKA